MVSGSGPNPPPGRLLPCIALHRIPFCEDVLDSYIVAYDIANDKRLRKVARIAEDFGVRKQYSVFFCRLGPRDMVRMRAQLYDVMKLDEDQVLFVPLCGKCVEQIDTLGRPTEAPTARDVVIVT
jgi:CRISPR-associated protein Cas2